MIIEATYRYHRWMPMLRFSVMMACYGVGTQEIKCVDGAGAAGVPSDVPPEQTNS